MKKCALTTLLLLVAFSVSKAQQEEPKHWVELGIGFHVQGGSPQVLSSRESTASILTKLGYKYWPSKKLGLGVDLVFGDIFINLPDAVFDFHEQVLEVSFMAHYKIIRAKKLDIYAGTGLGVTNFSNISSQDTPPALGTKTSIPIQLGLQYGLSRSAKFSLQVNKKNFIFDIPNYYQMSFGLSIGI